MEENKPVDKMNIFGRVDALEAQVLALTDIVFSQTVHASQMAEEFYSYKRDVENAMANRSNRTRPIVPNYPPPFQIAEHT